MLCVLLAALLTCLRCQPSAAFLQKGACEGNVQRNLQLSYPDPLVRLRRDGKGIPTCLRDFPAPLLTVGEAKEEILLDAILCSSASRQHVEVREAARSWCFDFFYGT